MATTSNTLIFLALVSQAARQWLSHVASAFVLLKHETLSFRESHNFISIDLTFAVGYYVMEVANLRLAVSLCCYLNVSFISIYVVPVQYQ